MQFENDSAESSFEIKFFEGINLYNQGKLKTSLTFFLKMLVDYPRSVGVLMFLGLIYSELGHLDLSIKYASQATAISPISEKSSLVLHNSLRNSGDRRQAYDEMERFFNTSGAQPSEDLYETYLNDLSKSLDISQEQYADKRMLVRDVIEKLDSLGLLENKEK